MASLRNDFHWGNLWLIAQFHTPTYGTDRQGNPYVMDTHGGPFMWRLRCACGYEWEIPRDEFPGRRNLRSCGRPECTVNQKPPKPARERKTTICASLPMDLVNQLTAYRTRQGTSQSKAVEVLLYKGLAQVLIED